MLAALVLAGLIAAPIGTAGLLVQSRRRAATAGAWPAVRRFTLAIGGTVVLAAIVVASLRLLGDSEHLAVEGAAGLAVSSLVWLPVTRRWNARGHLCWSATIFLFVVYLAFVLQWTFDSDLGPASTAGGLLLWLFELFAALLACAYLWEICDALGSEHWRRRLSRPEPGRVPDSDLPFISLHVPAHNEPPDMVLDTLRSLLRLDYPRFEVIVIDDNTDEEALWRPLEAWCARHGAKFRHLEDWPGYKSGALNYALREMTDPRAEIIGVVDSDYQLEPGFLRRCAPLFADAWVGFTQAPQDYRGWQRARYYRRLYYSYQYFFAVSQPSRNERDGAIFAGTMGLIRRVALEQLGGWDEWCITEDAELSLRLLRAGWSGLHVDESWGKGIMPLTFEALKGQRYRWCFGGIQMLRMHWRSLMPGPASARNRMTTGQRWSYLAGAVQWYGDLLGLLFLGVPARRCRESGYRRRRAVPQAHRVPGRHRPGARAPRARARRGTAAPRHRCLLAGRARRVLHLAGNLARGGPGLRAGAVRPQGRVPADAEDHRAAEMVGGPARELGGIVPGPARPAGHRLRAQPGHRAGRAAAGRAAALPHARHGRGAVQQLGRSARGAAS